ncbi:MAG: helix-turn-helix transcriptional regulator, partial [Isosphaeraceae bacterium]
MSQTDSKPALSPEQQAAVEAIRARSKIERPGPDELIDRGELDELVPHGQFMELRELTIRLRQIRERQGLSLTDVSERSGMTRAAISRLENGWNLGMVQLRVTAIPEVAIPWSSGFSRLTDRPADASLANGTKSAMA